MNQEEIRKEIAEIGGFQCPHDLELRLFDLHVHEQDDGTFKLNNRQGKAVGRLLKMFRVLGWELNFANHKNLVHADTKPLRPGIWGSGIPVKLRPCKKEHGDKTYFGILLGDMALQINHSVSGDTVTASHAFYNPAIYVIVADIERVIEEIRKLPEHPVAMVSYFYPRRFLMFREGATRRKRQKHLVALMRFFGADLRTAKALSLGKVDTGSAFISLKEIRELAAGGKAK